ncbi:unnamed protein product [Symbiodinium sp. CCMP2456]|nr:unnamed protein product [Symbiodinium sp. CCMP2456]
MQADEVPLLKDYGTYSTSLPVRELRNGEALALHQLLFYVTTSDLDAFAKRMGADVELRKSVDYIAAASHSGKSASVLVGFLRAMEQNTVDGQRSMNFSHYLYMPFANNGGNNHDSVDEDQLERACGKSTKLRETLGASYMRDCFKAQAFGQRFRFLRRLLHLHCEPTRYLQDWKPALRNFNTTKKLLQKDIFTFMQRNPSGTLLVHVDEHRCMCPDAHFRKGAMRVLAELPGVQVLATYTDIPPLPQQKSSETCRRPIACLLPDVGTIMKGRLPMQGIVENEAIQLRVATLRVTLGLALQKLLLAGLHFESSKIDQLLKDLKETLRNADNDVQGLEQCIQDCNKKWMDDSAEEQTSLVDLLCGIRENDRRVQEKRFPQVVALEDILTAPLEVLLRDGDDDSLSPANMLHVSCQKLFRQALTTSPRAAVTAGKILEYAYLWALACRSYKFSRLDFDELLVPFQCKDVQLGYIFQENKSLDSAKVAEMQTATLYYAQGNHPCADMFFKDDAGALYLVDVGGTSEMSKAQKKIQKMDEVLMNESLRDDLQVAVVKGVVLLPNIESIKASVTISAIAITRARARKLLGGLAQLLAWLPTV